MRLPQKWRKNFPLFSSCSMPRRGLSRSRRHLKAICLANHLHQVLKPNNIGTCDAIDIAKRRVKHHPFRRGTYRMLRILSVRIDQFGLCLGFGHAGRLVQYKHVKNGQQHAPAARPLTTPVHCISKNNAFPRQYSAKLCCFFKICVFCRKFCRCKREFVPR